MVKSAESSAVRNVYSRRTGRGLRPYLIVLKLLSVSAFLGGLLAVFGVLLAPEPIDAASWRNQASVIHRVFAGTIIPGVGAALVFGTLLFTSIWRTMIRMRWFISKITLIVVALPGLHLYLRSRSLALEGVLVQTTPDLHRAAEIREQMIIGILGAVAFAVTAVVLGRVKPRLGQDYVRTFSRSLRPGR